MIMDADHHIIPADFSYVLQDEHPCVKLPRGCFQSLHAFHYEQQEIWYWEKKFLIVVKQMLQLKWSNEMQEIEHQRSVSDCGKDNEEGSQIVTNTNILSTETTSDSQSGG